MSELKQLLIEEIKRGARREIKLEFENFQKTIEKQKESIDKLSERLTAIEETIKENAELLAGADEGQSHIPSTHVLKKELLKPARLVKFRLKNNLAQKHLALLLGVTTFSVSHWEKGHNIPSQANIDAFKQLENLGKRKLYAMLEEKGINVQQDFKMTKRRPLNNCRSKYPMQNTKNIDLPDPDGI